MFLGEGIMRKSVLFFSVFLFLLSAVFSVSCDSDSSSSKDEDATVDNDVTDAEPVVDDDATAQEKCAGSDFYPDGFNDGECGELNGSTACDFTMPVDGGEWTLSRDWNGCDSIMFLPVSSSNIGAWFTLYENDSFLTDFIDMAGLNVQVFILFYDSATYDADVKTFKERMEKSQFYLSSKEVNEVDSRFHIVAKPAGEVDSWVVKKFSMNKNSGLVIDRFQKIRIPLSIANWSRNMNPDISYVANEIKYYNFNWEREKKFESEKDKTLVVNALNGETLQDNLDFEVEFPASDVLDKYNMLEVELDQQCDGTAKTCEWDYLLYLYLCTDNEEVCSTEIARWITAYGSGGKWVTDITPMFPLIADGGKVKFRMSVYKQPYKTWLNFRFKNDESKLKPFKSVPLYQIAKSFNASYGDNFSPVTVNVPADMVKAEIAAFVTGHGFGTDTKNCAEFCDYDAVFTVNGTDYTKDNPWVGDDLGCLRQVKDGVIPNQAGSWPFGRGGWCPGLDVSPWREDVTNSVVKGSDAVVIHNAFMDGKPFEPVPTGDSDVNARIDATSYIVFYK